MTEAINSVLTERGRNVRVDIEYVQSYQASLKPFAEYYRAILPDASEQEIEEMTLATKAKCEEFLIQKHVKKMDDAEKVLREIKRNDDTVCVLSFSTAASIDIYLQITGLDRYIDKRMGIESSREISGDDDAAEVKARLLEKHLETEKGRYARIFLIGDSASDMKAGKHVGATNIYFTKTREVLDIADYSIDGLGSVLKIAYGDELSAREIRAQK